MLILGVITLTILEVLDFYRRGFLSSIDFGRDQ